MLEIECDRNVWKKITVERIKEHDRRWWKNGFAINEGEQEYIYK